MSEPLHHLLERNACKYPADPAVRHPATDVTLTWRELNAGANALASFLLKNGVGKGAKVALLIPNQPEFIIAFFAILKTGAAAVPINVRLTPAEINYILVNSDSCAVIFEESLRAAAEQALAPEIKVTLSTKDFASLKERFSTEDPGLPATVYDLAEIIYTSGTTGKPKGVLLTHNAVYCVGSMIAYETGIRYRDRVLHLMPLTHSAPLNLFLIGATYAGALNITGTFTPQALLEFVSQEKATHFFGAPVAYLLTLKLPNFDRYDLSSVKRWTYGGAAMSREQVLAALNKYPGSFMSLYGLTEAGPNGMAMYPEEHPRHAGSVGYRGSVNTATMLVDDEGRPVPAGEPGEILIKSPSLMLGYYKNEPATRESFLNGWLKTGDIARRDEEGYYWILDRKKDMIVSGGVNVYPKEIEDVLIRHPGVADVAVVGVPHREWGETVLAVIVPKPDQKPTLEEIRAFASNYLADFKLPHLLNYTEIIPRNASGKILKQEIREQYLKAQKN
ncbi:MAG: AMP-binding protein [Bacillota bacterium]